MRWSTSDSTVTLNAAHHCQNLDKGGFILHTSSGGPKGACVLALCLIAAATLTPTRTSFAQRPTLDAEHHPERLLVRFKTPTSDETINAVNQEIGALRLRKYRHIPGLVVVKVSPDRLAKALGDYLDRAEVLYAEPDYVLHVTHVPPGCDEGECPHVHPQCPDPEATNDTHVCKLWAMHNTGQYVNGNWGTDGADINALEAWTDASWTGNEDFRIAIIDTGVKYDHPDLAANIWTNPGETGLDEFGNPKETNNFDDDGNGYKDDVHGYDFLNNDGDPMDDHIDSHGTHVAGIIGAVANNSTGVVGVNWECNVVALKVMGVLGSGTVSDIIAAIDYAIDNGIKLSNNSYGCNPTAPTCAPDIESLEEAIERAKAAGHIYVAAAGNNSSIIGEGDFLPGTFDLNNIITVAATDNTDDLWSYSNYDAVKVDLGAPGVDIYSTTYNWQDHTEPRYGFLSGTSMATPHVTGVVALVWSKNTGWSWDLVRDRILQTARLPLLEDPNPLEGNCVTERILDAYAALVDCNTNGIPDDCDVDCGEEEGPCDVPGCGTGSDCDDNKFLDECELGTSYMFTFPIPVRDCQDNGVPDACDIASGPSEDCNNNDIPDECDLDSEDPDENGETSADCQGPGEPGRGIPDECDLAACAQEDLWCKDCNGNGIPDGCDITAGRSEDCDEAGVEGVPDECEPRSAACCVGGDCIDTFQSCCTGEFHRFDTCPSTCLDPN